MNIYASATGFKVYCLKCKNNPRMKYNGEGRGPLYICENCKTEIEVEPTYKIEKSK